MIAFIGEFVQYRLITKVLDSIYDCVKIGRIAGKHTHMESAVDEGSWWNYEHLKEYHKEPWYHIIGKDSYDCVPEKHVLSLVEFEDLSPLKPNPAEFPMPFGDMYEFLFGEKYKEIRNAKIEDLPVMIGKYTNKMHIQLIEERLKKC